MAGTDTLGVIATRHVLWVIEGSSVPGAQQPGGFTEQLIITMFKADSMNLSRLALGFPEYAEVVGLYRFVENGAEHLRQTLAKRDTHPGATETPKES